MRLSTATWGRVGPQWHDQTGAAEAVGAYVSPQGQHRLPALYTATAFGLPGSAKPCSVPPIQVEVLVHQATLNFKFPPTIEHVAGFALDVTPGGIVVVQGKFGPSQGKLLVQLQKGPPIEVQVLQWSNTFIGGKLDPAIEGQVAGNAQFQVVAQNGEKSAWFTNNKGAGPIKFKPKIVSVVLQPATVTVVQCSEDAGNNQCNGVTSHHPNVWSILPASPWYYSPIQTLNTDGTCCSPTGPSITSQHASDWGWSSDDDIDMYSVSLKNGWTIEQMDVEIAQQINGTVDVKQNIAVGSTGGQLLVHYHIGASGGSVAYGAFIVVKGPKGVAF